MDMPEKSEAGPSAPLETFDAPPAYTPQPPPAPSAPTTDNQINDERNPATIPSTMGPKKVYTTYHIYLEQNYMRKVKVALVKHLNSDSPSYVFEFPDEGEHAGQMVMYAGEKTEGGALGTASFATEFGSSRLELSDGRVASISVVPRRDKSQKVRLFRLDISNSASASASSMPLPQPNTMFWEMGSRNHGASSSGFGNLEFMDEDRKVYAVLLTGWHKSMKKMGRLHWLVEPRGELVEMGLGSLMAIWKKAERDVRSGHVGLGI
ncbi:uncharacterized protein N0V89_003794 [Didymosphaeria variabile]|uniref:Uncharacterized protein n=1 Tax=Didymosphaeria variabile TaxID=1932322 RepID=A0A9W8XQY4_9PLEO|nr:uncharacterized protein N0V89_003794 [Didymosphaeria variabile]KAJ4355773.1 hypothetical protein N0V89_003794 [Didymosphaeria variabile]